MDESRQQKKQELRAQQEEAQEELESSISALREALDTLIKVDEGEIVDALPFDAQKLIKFTHFAQQGIRKSFSLQEDIAQLESEEHEERIQPLIDALEELKEDIRAHSLLSSLDLFNDEPEQE